MEAPAGGMPAFPGRPRAPQRRRPGRSTALEQNQRRGLAAPAPPVQGANSATRGPFSRLEPRARSGARSGRPGPSSLWGLDSRPRVCWALPIRQRPSGIGARPTTAAGCGVIPIASREGTGGAPSAAGKVTAMMRVIGGLLAAMVTFALTACTVPVEPAPEEIGEAAEMFTSCNDANPCTADTYIDGAAGPVCLHEALPGGTRCSVGACSSTCYPPKQTETGIIHGYCACPGCQSHCACDDGNPCTWDYCDGGECTHGTRDGLSCGDEYPLGTCRGSWCCFGWDCFEVREDRTDCD